MEFFSTAQPRNSAVTRLQAHRVSSPNTAGLTPQPHSVSPLRLQCSGAKHCSLTPGTMQTCSQNTIGLQSNPCRVRGGITAIFIDGRAKQSNQRVCRQGSCLALYAEPCGGSQTITRTIRADYLCRAQAVTVRHHQLSSYRKIAPNNSEQKRLPRKEAFQIHSKAIIYRPEFRNAC